ncbi:MAG: Stp1/IreP family PP2C-type Ser/Thr phosphatase [Proteobacteria bacterium]|nr:Stp1/IreP family PP2C-type Ser/Thr phosphatase [Pseudomonadota bacterium]MCP4921490.1 Stp1/IreP family PP2C-type Ser/Thr phosphatase [Pseudomonadota bacterium]
MRITSCGITDVGMKRTNNEDNYLVNDELNLFVCCDGMGGHVGGEYASAIAVNTVEEVLTTIEQDPDVTLPDAENPVERSREKLRYAIRLAGKRIFEKAAAEPEYKGMGTTALALLLDSGNFYIAHVGDSRGYLLREGRIEQLTEDHSLVYQKVKEGVLTPEEAKTHKLRNIITRSLGYMEEVEVDLQVRAIRRGDKFMLCSDGLSNFVSTAEIGELLHRNAPQQAARQLIQLACDRGGDDNITCVAVRVDEA